MNPYGQVLHSGRTRPGAVRVQHHQRVHRMKRFPYPQRCRPTRSCARAPACSCTTSRNSCSCTSAPGRPQRQAGRQEDGAGPGRASVTVSRSWPRCCWRTSHAGDESRCRRPWPRCCGAWTTTASNCPRTPRPAEVRRSISRPSEAVSMKTPKTPQLSSRWRING